MIIMKTKNKGSIWHNLEWEKIFEYLPTIEHNQYKAWWIEKVYRPSDNIFENDVFSHYQLKCEEGYKNKIPEVFNEYIRNTFKDAKYITELKNNGQNKLF